MKIDETDYFSGSRKVAHIFIFASLLIIVIEIIVWGLFFDFKINNHKQPTSTENKSKVVREKYYRDITITVIEDCEYLIYNSQSITHKGNCKHCYMRR